MDVNIKKAIRDYLPQVVHMSLATTSGDSLRQRLGIGEAALGEAKRADGHKFYKISVEKHYLFDARDTKPSQKFELKWSGGK